jgi:hypothetical protein
MAETGQFLSGMLNYGLRLGGQNGFHGSQITY